VLAVSLSTITLKWDLTDLIEAGLSATLSITPTAQMTDTVDHVLIPPVARAYTFTGGTGQLAGIVANDNANILPSGSGYLISVTSASGQVIVPQFQTQLNFANGATQWLDALVAVPVVATAYQYLPVTGMAAVGFVAAGSLAPRVVTLTDAPVTLVNAALGNDFRWLLGGNHQLGAPSNAADGQAFTVDIQQPAGGGPFTPSFASGAGGYAFGADGTPTWSTAASAVDEVAFRYNATRGLWLCQGWKLGF
jgi:hypothetical protein